MLLYQFFTAFKINIPILLSILISRYLILKSNTLLQILHNHYIHNATRKFPILWHSIVVKQHASSHSKLSKNKSKLGFTLLTSKYYIYIHKNILLLMYNSTQSFYNELFKCSLGSFSVSYEIFRAQQIIIRIYESLMSLRVSSFACEYVPF